MIINKLTYISIKTMNQDLLRVFETESDYDLAKDGFVYPTVSYVKDVDDVRYMTKPLLPMIDTTGYATEFTLGEYYPQEALVFKAIYDMYASRIPTDTEYYYQLFINTDGNIGIIWHVNYERQEEIFANVTSQPLYINYINHIFTDSAVDFIYMTEYKVQIGYKAYLKYENGEAWMDE